MVLSREITTRIREVLEKHPEGLSITDLVRSVDINRNTAGRYLENMLLSGQVEMRRFGMAKMYTLTKRLPVSSVLSISSELVLQLDSSLRVIYANDPLLTFLHVPAKDLFGKNIEFTQFSIVFEDVFSELLDRFRRGHKGEEWYGELSSPVEERFFFCRIAPNVSSEGSKGVSVLLEDITDQKRDGERIRKSEARLRSIFKVSPIGIGLVADRVFLEVNDFFCEMTGYTPAELVGKSARMLYPSEEAFATVGTLYYNQIRRSGAGSIETQLIRKDGTAIDVLMNSTPLDPANIAGGITFTAMDITERKRSERALRKSESRLQLALSGSEMGMWEIDIPSLKGSIDERAAAILGMKKNDIGTYRADWDALSHPDDIPLIHQRLINHIEGRAVIFESEHRMRHTSGRWIWVLGRGKIIHRLPDGSCMRISGTMQDITARKQAEEALRESEDRYRKLVEISPDAVILHQDGKIIYMNPAALRILGARNNSQMTGRSILEIIHPDYRNMVMANIDKDLAGEGSPAVELQLLRTDGTPVFVEGRGVGTFIDGRPAVLVAISDITERRHAEQALKESEERYRTLAEASQDIIYLIGRDDRVEYVNSYAAAVQGVPAHEIIGKKRSSLFSGELEQRQAQGLRRVFETGKAGHSEGAMDIAGTLRWFDHYLMPITDVHGKVTSVLGVSRDITDRKKAEDALHDSEEQYRHLLEQTFDAVAVHKDRKIAFLNEKAARILGAASPQDLIGRPIFDLIHPDSCRDLENRIRLIDSDPSKPAPVLREKFCRVDGTTVTVEVMALRITDNGVPAVQVLFREVNSP